MRKQLRALRRTAQIEIDVITSRLRHADVSIFHEFVPPPIGGGHQFLRALWLALEERGWKVENNTLSTGTRACLFNSFNFDAQRLRRMRRDGIRYVHRVDGPIDVYRGHDEGVDRQIWQTNLEFADATVFQSQYSLSRHIELGMQFRSPVVIPNAADPGIFHASGHIPFSRDRKIRVISVSWSDNPNKGAAVYQWLDQHLDFDRYEYSFVGRLPVELKNIRTCPPAPSLELARLLRQHDIYLTASRHDPCSNSLIEALSCGLPAIYLRSGGHPELVGEAGLGFEAPEEIPVLLEQLIQEYEGLQGRISVPNLNTTTQRYLDVLGIGGER